MGRKRMGPGAPASATEALITSTSSQHNALDQASQVKQAKWNLRGEWHERAC